MQHILCRLGRSLVFAAAGTAAFLACKIGMFAWLDRRDSGFRAAKVIKSQTCHP